MNDGKRILIFVLSAMLLTGCANHSDEAEDTIHTEENTIAAFENTTTEHTEDMADANKIKVPDVLPEAVAAYREKRTYYEDGEEPVIFFYAYDEKGNVISEKKEDSTKGESKYAYVYNENGQIQVKFWGSVDEYDTYQYNEDGTVKQYCWYDNGELKRTKEYEYDTHGNETEVVEKVYLTDGEVIVSNKVTKNLYDDNGNETVTIAYDEEGKEEFRSCMEYDDNNRAIKSYLLFDGQTDYLTYETYLYDDNGNIVRSDIYGKENSDFEIVSYTLYEYDEKNRRIKEETFKDGSSKRSTVREYEDLVKMP